MLGSSGSELRRSSSASVAAKRLSHPTSLVAFTKRIESVVNKGKVLTVQETQQFRNASLCDFERLAVPKVKQPTKTEREEIRALRSFAAQRQVKPGRNDSGSPNMMEDSQMLSLPIPFSSASSAHHTERPPTPMEVQRWKHERRSKLQIAVQWPPPNTGCKLAERDRRLSPNCLSSTLRRAVYGQSLDRILERNEERLEQEEARSHASPDGGERGEEAHRVAVADGADSFSPTAAKRNKNNNLFLMAAHEHAAARQQGEEAQTVDLSGTTNSTLPNGSASTSQDLGTYLTNLADPAFRKTLTTVAPQAYALVRKLFQELDDKHEGVVELAKALQFHNKYPKRLGRDILDNLHVELDGRIYLDELIRVHFPSVPQDSIEQLIELLEPKVQSMDAVAPHTMHQLEVLYLQIIAKYSHATFAWWLASRRASSSGGAGADSSPRAGGTECSTARPDSSTGLRASDGPDGSMDDDGRASTTSRSDAGTHITTGRRHSLPPSSSGVSSSATTAPHVVMNAMQLLMHLQHTANFSVKELTQLYRLKHIALRPAYNLALSRAIRRANATTAASNHRASIYGSLSRSTTTPPPTANGTTTTGAIVVSDPTTGVPIPLALLQAPHTPSGEPSLPYLTNCAVRFHDFVVLLMEYYVMKQSDAYVEPYDPNLRAYLDRIHWDKLFPYTGPVKKYFAPMPS